MAFTSLEDLRFVPSKRDLNDNVILVRFLSQELCLTDTLLVQA